MRASTPDATRVAAELGAVGEHHTFRPPVAREDPAHRRAGPDFGPRFPRRGRDGVGDAAHAAAHVPPDAAGAVALAHHVMEEHVGRARHGRRGPRADHRVGGEGDLELLGLEPAVENGARRAGQDLERVGGILAEPEETEAQPAELHEIGGLERPRGGRRRDECRLDEGRHALQHRLVLRQRVGVAGRELRHLAVGQRLVGAEHERPAVGKRRERRGAPRQHLEAVPLEVEVADDLGAEEAVDVGRGRDLEPGPELLGDAGAAQQVAALEHQRLEAGPGRVGRRDEAVVPAADDDQIVRARHARLPLGVCRVRSAAARPPTLRSGAPARGSRHPPPPARTVRTP